ncbi:MAG: hypothetical protein AMXMBFR59_36890 [Rhodanobacteraceae bacterium]
MRSEAGRGGGGAARVTAAAPTASDADPGRGDRIARRMLPRKRVLRRGRTGRRGAI